MTTESGELAPDLKQGCSWREAKIHCPLLLRFFQPTVKRLEPGSWVIFWDWWVSYGYFSNSFREPLLPLSVAELAVPRSPISENESGLHKGCGEATNPRLLPNAKTRRGPRQPLGWLLLLYLRL